MELQHLKFSFKACGPLSRKNHHDGPAITPADQTDRVVVRSRQAFVNLRGIPPFPKGGAIEARLSKLRTPRHLPEVAVHLRLGRSEFPGTHRVYSGRVHW
jgi:hypothetical protein